MRVSNLRLTVDSPRLGHKHEQRGGYNCILAVSFDQFAHGWVCKIDLQDRENNAEWNPGWSGSDLILFYFSWLCLNSLPPDPAVMEQSRWKRYWMRICCCYPGCRWS